MKQPKPKKVSGGKSTQIRAATKAELKANLEFPKSYGATDKMTATDSALVRLRARMDKNNNRYTTDNSYKYTVGGSKVVAAHELSKARKKK